MATTKKKVKKAVKNRPVTKSRQAPKKSARGKKTPAKQASKIDGCGNGGIKPPKKHRFKTGQSGNPKGPPKRRTQLWLYFCEYMALMDAKLAKLDRTKLSQSQQTALRLVENAKAGKYSGSERLARHIFDREEGKALEHLVIENDNTLTDEECEDIREVLLKNAVE